MFRVKPAMVSRHMLARCERPAKTLRYTTERMLGMPRGGLDGVVVRNSCFLALELELTSEQ